MANRFGWRPEKRAACHSLSLHETGEATCLLSERPTALKLLPIYITFFYIRAPSAQPHVTHEGGRMIASAPGLGRSGMREWEPTSAAALHARPVIINRDGQILLQVAAAACCARCALLPTIAIT